MTEEHDEMPDDNIGARARTAVGWRALSQFSSQGITIVTSIILARLLMPDDFGIIGMAGIVTGLAGVFRDLGFGQALVQRPELREEHKRAAFWVTLILSGLLYGGIYLVAPYAGEYFRDERMVPVLRIMALSFLMAPFGVVPRSLLQRELDFKRPFIAGLASTIVSGGVGITCAVLGYGYWSLVWALLASSAVGTVAICIITRYAPPLIPSLKGAKDLLQFGGGVTGIGLLAYVTTRVDYLIIGRRLTADALGLYTRAYVLVTLPLTLLSAIFYPITLSAFSAIQGDLPRMRHVFGRFLSTILTFAFPALALLGVTAPELIRTVLGEQWAGAVVPTQILLMVGVARVICNPAAGVVKARGTYYVYQELWRQAVSTVLLAFGAWYGAAWGFVGVAWGVSIAWLGILLLSAHLVYVAIGFGPSAYLKALRGAILISGVVAGASLLVRSLSTSLLHGEPEWTLVTTILTGLGSGIVAVIYSPCSETRLALQEVRRALGVVPRASGE